MPAEPATVDQPGHPVRALTTFELRDYRRKLETALASFDTQNPAARAQADLQTRLDQVLAEQDDRARIAHA